MNRLFVAGCCGVVASVFMAGTCGAVSNAGGTFELTQQLLSNDMRTTGQTGDQTYVLGSASSTTRFWPGANDATPYWQIFTGAPISVSGGQAFRIMGGNVVLENAITSAATENYVGLVLPAQLVLRNGGSLTVTKAALEIGKYRAASPDATGALYMEEPSSLFASNVNIRVGAGSTGGMLWMDGGTTFFTNAIVNVSAASGSCGYLRVNGGSFLLQRGISNADVVGAQIGATASTYGSLHISGGTMTAKENRYGSSLYFRTSTEQDAVSDVYLDGGVLDLSGVRSSIGFWPSAGSGRASFTVDGDARADLALVGLGCNASCKSANGGRSVVNMNGGALRMRKGFADYSAKAERWINFNGGTLELRNEASCSGGSAYNFVVYPRGGTISVEGTSNLSASFRTAGGCGVESIVLDNPGVGYVTAPEVTITGGSGSNATAYAVMKKDRTIEKIVVTCRGEGYAADDALTVTIASVNGSGASAHVSAITPNTAPVLRMTGSGTLNVSANVRFDGIRLSVEEGTLRLPDGKGIDGLAELRISEGAYLRPTRSTAGVTNVASVSRLDAVEGISTIRYDGNAGVAELDIGLFTRSNGLAAVDFPGTVLKIDSTEFLSTSTASPVVNGLFSKGTGTVSDPAKNRDPNVYVRGDDGRLELAEFSNAPGPDLNWNALDDTFACEKVNSVVLPSPCKRDSYLQNDGPVEIQSGMILGGHNGTGVSRVGVKGTGAYLTTRAKGGMVIWENNTMGRSRGSAHNNEVYYDAAGPGARRFIIGAMKDPDAQTPMTVTVAGPRCPRPDKGALIWDISSNDFSGGLVLLNGGVLLYAENGLGRDGCPIDVYGRSAIVRGPNGDNLLSLGERPLRIHDDAVLIFSPNSGNGGNTVAATLSGSGDLMTSDIDRSGYAMAYTGDHSAFTGAYYIQGHARIAPATFSAQATICLADGTNGVGVIETSGSFTRAPGTGKGELCWKRHATMPAAYGLLGGFAAKGGVFTVNLGGDARKLEVGSDYLPEGAVIQLQSQYADGALDFQNGFALGGKTQAVRMWSGKTATISGDISDAVGGGQLAVKGNLAFTGTLEETATTLGAAKPLLAVAGNLDFTDAQVDVQADAAELDAFQQGDGVVLATATGTITGLPMFKTAPQGAWTLRVKNGSLLLSAVKGTMLIFR